MSKLKSILISMDFRESKGGISRVAHLISYAQTPDRIFSYLGDDPKSQKVKYFNKNIFYFIFSLIKSILINRPDIIVFDHIGPSTALLFIPSFFLKKVIVFLHDEEAWKEVKGRHKLGLLKATHILCNSHYTYTRFIENNPDLKNKTTVCLLAGVPNKFLEKKKSSIGVPNKEFKLWLQDPRPFCLFVSRLWKEHRYKGYLQLIEAFALHYKSYPKSQLRLAIVGNGDDELEIIKRIKKHALESSVGLFTGISDDDLVNLYECSLALLFPSTREGFGFVFLEAMFFKKACIGIKGQPVEEIIKEGVDGLLINNNSPETIQKVLEEMEKDPERFINYGLNAYKTFHENFSNKHFKERFLKIINN